MPDTTARNSLLQRSWVELAVCVAFIGAIFQYIADTLLAERMRKPRKS